MRTCGLLLVILLASCGGNRRGGTDEDADADGDADSDADGGDCVDLDGDGAGRGDGCSADDCDDTDPGTTDQCGSDCATHPERFGCPCTEGSVQPCYHGPAGTGSVGTCAAGIQRCVDGALGTCDDQILPVAEACDEIDTDCDGTVDNGVVNECGTCGPCEQHCAGPGDDCQDFETQEESGGIIETPEGYLELGGTATSLHVIWPSSAGNGQILRVDSQTFDILGAYYTGPNRGSDFGGGDSPSRTAVDDYGSVVIANRAFGVMASITKIASSDALCIDRNGNGIIDTSHSWDEILPFDAHDDWEDECILWHTIVGDINDAVARAVAIHTVVGLDGVARDLGWVGMYTEGRFLEFDVETGELTGNEAPTPGCLPYGGALDREGWLWATCLSTIIGRFDTANPEGSFETFALPNGGSGYRVIVDENDAPWISGTDAWRYDRQTEEFEPVGLSGGFGFVGGISSDGEGSVWVGTYADGQYVHRIANDDSLEHHQIDTPGVNTFGTSVDFDGHAWTFGYTDGTAATIDIETEEVTHVLNDCGGAACLNTPYVRGDITGLQRRNALNPTGTFTRVLEGCEDGAETTWTRVVADADTPPGSNLAVAVKTADDLAAMAAMQWIPVGLIPDDGTELDVEAALAAAGVEHGHYLTVQVRLQALDHVTSPTVRQIDVQWGCEGIIQ